MVRSNLPQSVRQLNFSWPQLGVLVLAGALGFYMLYPLALIVLNGFNSARLGQPPVYSLETWLRTWSEPGLLTAFLNTISVAVVYQGLSFPLAVIIAWALARTNVPWARGLEFFFWLSFFIPTLSTALGWILLADPQLGLLNTWIARLFGLRDGPFDIYSFWGIIWVHLASHAVSIKVMLLTPAFRNMDAALEEAGRLSGASTFQTFFRVTLPVLTPALVIVLTIGFIRLFESFEIELLLGVPFGFFVYSTQIVGLIREDPPMIAEASTLGSLTLLVLLVAVPLQRWLTTRREYTTITSRMRPSKVDLGPWRWLVFAVLLVIGMILVVVPLASLIAGSLMTRFGFFNLREVWSLVHWERILRDSAFTSALQNTLLLAVTVALIAPLLFSTLAYVIVKGRGLRGRGFLDFLVWVPSVIPGALAGLGLLWMFLGVPIFQPLYGSMALLLLAVLLGGTTISTQISRATLMQIGRELEESARMSGAGWFTTFRRVVVPLLAPTLVVVGVLSFLSASHATSSIIMLSTSETRTLSLLALEYSREGLRESATVVAVLITGLTTGVALVARSLGLNIGVRS